MNFLLYLGIEIQFWIILDFMHKVCMIIKIKIDIQFSTQILKSKVKFFVCRLFISAYAKYQ